MKPHIWRLGMLALLMALGSCTLIQKGDNIRPIEFDRDLAFPLARTSVTLSELLDGFDSSGSFEVDNSGLITYKYDSTVNIYSGDDFGGITDFQSPVGDTLNTLELETLLSQSITKANLKGGVLTYFVQVDSPGDYTLFMELPEITQGGMPLQVQRTDFYNDSITGVVPLNGYEVNAPQEEISLKILLRSAVSNQLVLPRDARIGAQGIEFSYLQLKNIAYDFSSQRDSIGAGIFPNTANGDIFFADPSLDLTFINSFGIPLDVTVNELSTKGNSGEKVALESALLNDPISINFPNINNLGSSESTFLSFNKDNSNFVDFFNVIPQELIYDFISSAFYTSSGPSDPDIFVLDTSRLDLNVAFTLPLNIRIEEFSFSDSLDISLDIPELGQYKEAEFKLITENEIPLTASVQAYFLQDGAGILDSLFDGFKPVLGPASVDANGNVTQVSVQEFFFSLTNERIEKLRNANKLLIRSVFSTPNQPGGTVNMYENARLNLKLGIKTLSD